MMNLWMLTFEPIAKGGWVSWVLLCLAVFLWYAIGYRYWVLRNANRFDILSIYRSPIQSIVIVAPLLGLLGTVIGMIETFDSLQDSSMYSQSGGIAGGISQALVTTQMGLLVAIPGLLIGRQLDKKQKSIEEVR